MALDRLFPQLPYEILNIILSFTDNDTLVGFYFHIPTGRIVPIIRWESELIYELSSMIFVRRIFPYYWYHDADIHEKYIYFFMKDYFRHLIKEEGLE